MASSSSSRQSRSMPTGDGKSDANLRSLSSFIKFGTEYEKFPTQKDLDEPVLVNAARLKEKKYDWRQYRPADALRRPMEVAGDDDAMQNMRSLISMVVPFVRSWHKRQVADDKKKEWFDALCRTSTPAFLYFPDLCEEFTTATYGTGIVFTAHPFMHPFIYNVKLYVILAGGNTVWDCVFTL